MSPQQLLLQAVDVETNLGPAPQCAVCRKSTSSKAVICSTCQKSIHRCCSGITRTMLEQWCQANNYQCPNCRSGPNSQILCCKCGKAYRLNHNRATCRVGNATVHLECTVQSRRERERTSETILWSWNCCNLPVTMTMPNSYLLHPLHQPVMKSIMEPVTFQSLLTFTSSECHRIIKKSSLIATCTTCGLSWHLASTCLPTREREGICDGCREWRCCGTAKSPSTMLQEVPIIYPKTQEDGVTTQPIPQKKFKQPTDYWKGPHAQLAQTGSNRVSRRSVCWSCKAQYHSNCMMSNRTQVVRTQMTQRWRCTHCSQKPG